MTDLKVLAQKLADAKANADAAKTAYDALKAEWEARIEVANALRLKREADAEKKQLEAEIREALEQKFTDNVTISSPYYDIQTTIEPEYRRRDDFVKKGVVKWLVENAPALAMDLLTIDEKAMDALIKANAVKTCKEGQWYANWPVYLESALRPIALAVTPKPRIMWSKLPPASEPSEPMSGESDDPDLDDAIEIDKQPSTIKPATVADLNDPAGQGEPETPF